MYHTSSLIHLSMVIAIVNSAGMKTKVYVSFQIMFFSGAYAQEWDP